MYGPSPRAEHSRALPQWRFLFAAPYWLRLLDRLTNGNIPNLEVDASWPQALPNKWAIGQVAGLAVGAQDHIWILHRPATLGPDEKLAATSPPSAECCIPAPPVIRICMSKRHPAVNEMWLTSDVA